MQTKLKQFKKRKILLILIKLALISLYYKNKIDYKYKNIGKFLNNIQILLKQKY